MASAVDSRLAYARLSAVATASRLPTANRGSNNSYNVLGHDPTTPTPRPGTRPTPRTAAQKMDQCLRRPLEFCSAVDNKTAVQCDMLLPVQRSIDTEGVSYRSMTGTSESDPISLDTEMA